MEIPNGSNASKQALPVRSGVHFEALESRILFDATAGSAPTAEVSVATGALTANDDQFINDNIEFKITFDNNGGQEGYTPYVDFLARPEMDIQGVRAFGSTLTNANGDGSNPIGVVGANGQLISISNGQPVNHPQFASSIGNPPSNYFGGAGSGTPPVLYDASFAGFYVYSVQLPFGSYTPGNPPVEISVEASLDYADGIVPNTSYALHARGGYALGCDPLNNPGTVANPGDAPVFGSFANSSVHPVVLDLIKTAGVVEGEAPFIGENVSGPNHPITYRLAVDVATGETINNLLLTDILPDDLAYIGNLRVTNGSGGAIPFTINSQPTVATDNLTGVSSFSNTLSLTFPSVTGVNGADIIVTYDVFIPYREQGGTLVINQVTGQENDLDDYNDAQVSGLWRGINVGDNAAPPANGGDPDGVTGGVETDYIIDEHSIAIQKGVDFAPGGDRGNAGWAEGDVAEYRLNFQISDYFAFDNIVVDDLMADGLEFLPNLGSPSSWVNAADFDRDTLELRPVLTLTTHHGGVISVAFDEANFTAVENPDGSTSIRFDVYQQLVDSGYIIAGEPILGGLIPEAGINPALLGTFNSGVATVGSITYRAKVRDEFTTAIGDLQVNQGDILRNTTTITGRNLDIENFAPLDQVNDGSSASIQIVVGNVTKELFSATRNGVQRFPGDLDNGLEVAPGDVITWRITYELPLSEFEGLSLTDYLPLPVFNVSQIDTSGIYAYDASGYLIGGRVSFALEDTFFGGRGPGSTGDGGIDDNAGYATPPVPTLSLDPANNALRLNFGSYNIPEDLEPRGTRIVVYISTTIQNAVYADGLLFTNQVGASESDSFAITSASNEISQIRLGVPELSITKGVLATAAPNGGSFIGSRGPNGVSFNAPGSATAFTGTITSNGLDTNPINANSLGLDASDRVTFGILVQNTGASDYGAFDVRVTDSLPAGFALPGTLAALNLRVTDGAGNPLAYNIVGGGTTPADFFANGIELVDPSANQGALTEYDPTSGTNLVLIAYDLVLTTTVEAASVQTNTATIAGYSYNNGGVNYANPGDTDTATVTVARPVVTKTVIRTSHVDAANVESQREVAVGEVVTYSVSIRVPEGTLPNVRILDTLPTGMAFVGLDSISFDSALSTNLGAGDFSDVTAVFNSAASTLELGINGTPGLGTITNSNQNNAVAETITFTYRAVVLNAAVNQPGVVRSNDAEIRWQENGNNQLAEAAINVRVVEPNISVTKSVVGGVTTVEGAQQITYRILIQNVNANGNVSEGYDVSLSDLLPTDVSFVSASFISGVSPDGGNVTFNSGVGPEGEITATWARFGVGQTATIDVVVRIDDGLPTDRIIGNTARVAFTSLPGEIGDAGYTGFNPATGFGPGINQNNPVFTTAVERTGDPSDPGGALNDYNRNNSVNVTVSNPTGIDKLIVDTSENHTGADRSIDGPVNAAIGEVVRYEIRILIPQAANSQVQLVDLLGPGLAWIDASANNLQIRLEGFAANGSTLSADADISAANGSLITLDPARVSFQAGTNTVTFNLGNITNTETDGAPEYIYIAYNAIAANNVANTRGTVVTNTVQLREGGSNLGSPLTQSFRIVEPELTLTKSDNGRTTADAGDIITYTLTVAALNGGTGFHTTAYDLAIADTLPSELELIGSSFSVNGLPGGTNLLSFTENTSTGQVTANFNQLAPGESFTISFQARVRDSGPNIIRADETVTNTASLSYSSLPLAGTKNGSSGNTTGNESGTPGTTTGERQFARQNSDSFTSPAPVLTKVLADPGDTTRTIGETIEYVLTLRVPEGALGSPNAFILDQIDPGLRFVPGTLQVTLGNGVTVATGGTLDESNASFFTYTDPGNTALAETFRLQFGEVSYNAGNAINGVNQTGTITVRYLARVENILTNQQGILRNNIAAFSYTDEDGTTTNSVADSTGSADTIITIVEPQVNVTKDFTNLPTTRQAGTIIGYEVVLSHPGGPGNPLQNVTAYDLSVRDVLPANLILQTGTFTATLSDGTDVTNFFTVGTSGWTNNPASSLDLNPGQIISIRYNAVLNTSVRDGDNLTNVVDLEWTSLDGTVFNERSGNGDLGSVAGIGNPNDYEGSTKLVFQANLTPVFDFSKAVATTSAPQTGNAAGTNASVTDLVIGETVTYTLTATLGRGTTDGVRIVDQLAINNGLLNILNVQVSTGNALRLGSDAAFSSIVPVTTDAAGSDGYRDRVVVDFGSIINDPAFSTGVADEQITITITAIVVNDGANRAGDVIRNTGQFFFLDDPDGDGIRTEQTIARSIDVEILEAQVNVAKTITSVPTAPQAGDTVSYQVAITHPGGPANPTRNVPAYDVTARDVLPANLTLHTGTFTATLNGATDVSAFFIATSTGWTTNPATSLDLNPGDLIVVTYSALLGTGVKDGDTLTNRVALEWTSLDAQSNDGVDSNDTGERTGDGNLGTLAGPGNPNTYESGDTASFQVDFTSIFEFSKAIFSTSQSNTGAAGGTSAGIEDLVVGETVTYALTATLGRGTTEGVRIIDQLNIANGALDITGVTFQAGSALRLASGEAFTTITPTISDALGIDGYRDRVMLDFGTVINDPSLALGGDSERIIVYVTAVVVNTVRNRAGDVIANQAEFRYFDDPDGDGTRTEQVINREVSVELLEPNLSITKAVSNSQPRLNEVITYTLTITNNGSVSATDAFDLVIDDFMDPRMSLDAGSVQLLISGTPANPSAIVSNTSSTNRLILGIDRLDEGESIQITYQVRVTSTPADFDAVLKNLADLTYTSTPGDNVNERGGNPDPSNPNDPNDYRDSDSNSVEVYQPDLRITKVDNDAIILPGEEVRYILTVTNQGRAEARSVTVSDDIRAYLDAGFEFVSGTNASLNGTIVTFNLPDMVINDVQVLEIILRAPAIIPAGLESIENTARANHDDIDPTPDDNVDTEDTPVTANPDLQITKDDGVLVARTGDFLTYLITYRNVGDQTSSGITIVDTLPPGVRFVSATDGGVYSESGVDPLIVRQVTWTLPDAVPGEVYAIELVVRVVRPGIQINTVTIDDDGNGGSDPTPENNTAEDETLTKWRFRYDLNQDFRRMNPVHDNGGRGLERHEPFVLATHMNSGLAQSGSTIRLKVYDDQGRLIGDTSVVADAGGNWLATFPMANLDRQPARVEMTQSWATYNPVGDRSYNFRTYFGPAFTTGTYYTETLSVYDITEDRSALEVLDLYEASQMILAMDWNGSPYEFAVRGALQSSSGN
jgi:fimbrial isopeptide formation D2 family protein/uncharacterized repeat protein (TIGR01451 family)